MKNILIPYDFSETAINTLRYTKELFKGFKLNIYLLNVYISNQSSLLSKEENEKWFNEMDDDIDNELNYLLDILNKEDVSFSYYGIVNSDSLTSATKKAINEKKIDLIISGTKGAKSLTETFIGTNTIKIINTIDNCPILVVPINYKYKPLQQIIFSTNYKRPFNKYEFKALHHLSAFKNCPVEVVNLSEESVLTEKQRTYKLELSEIFKDLEVKYKKLEWIESERITVENHVENTESGLLTLINHKYNFFNRFLEGDIIKKSTFHSKIPLLILPEL